MMLYVRVATAMRTIVYANNSLYVTIMYPPQRKISVLRQIECVGHSCSLVLGVPPTVLIAPQIL